MQQEPEQLVLDEYQQFVDKFKPKKTTDDCYTPQNIYDVIAGWVEKEYGIKREHFVRPFYPGGDFERYDYKPGDCVVDNPPFSILSKICAWYDAHKIGFFLFAPSLTLFSTNSGKDNYVITDSDITYHNGAKVRTGFVTNLGIDKVFCSSELHRLIKEQNEINTKPEKTLPKYAYPENVLTAATIQKICKYGIDLRIPKQDALFVRALDSQIAQGKSCFGSAFLLSEKAAAEKAAAEKAAAEKAAAEKAAATQWQLSERELSLIAYLGGERSGKP